jgi:hypothetical protein
MDQLIVGAGFLKNARALRRETARESFRVRGLRRIVADQTFDACRRKSPGEPQENVIGGGAGRRLLSLYGTGR